MSRQSTSALVGIIDGVRNTVLNWTLKLEEDGILEGLTFNDKKKQQGIDLKVLNEIIRELKQSIPALELGSTEDAQMIADIQGIESQLESPRPNQTVIRELMASLTNILEGCAGSILAAGLLHKLVGL
jgi:hypothetical protein